MLYYQRVRNKILESGPRDPNCHKGKILDHYAKSGPIQDHFSNVSGPVLVSQFQSQLKIGKCGWDSQKIVKEITLGKKKKSLDREVNSGPKG